jgi:hypothetical protein
VTHHRRWPLRCSGTDAIALTERLTVAEVATLDLRHFAVVRPKLVSAARPAGA